MEEVQAVMGVPEWFLYTDSRETKSLYGNKCIQESNETVPAPPLQHVHCFRSGIESTLFPTDQAALRRAGRQQAGAGLQQAAADGQAPRPQRAHPRLRGRPQQEDKVSGSSFAILPDAA